MTIPILDNHLHLQPSGKGVEALRAFSKAGGTHAVLCHVPYSEVVISSPEDFAASYKITLDMADKGRRETDVKVFVTLGPYPILLIGLAERFGLDRAVEVMKGGMEIAQALVQENKAIGIGEIGRPHFPVPTEIWNASNDIMEYGMKLASEADCPVILHTEAGTPDIMADLAGHADRAGLARGKVIKHYSPPLITEAENHGLFPSVLARKDAILEAISKGTRFMMETDYIDDPERPGAVLDITTVPKRTCSMLRSGSLTEEAAAIIHKDNPKKVYDIDIE